MRNKIMINAFDLELFLKINMYRYVDREFILKNCYQTNRTVESRKKRVQALCRCGYLNAMTMFVPEDVPLKHKGYYNIYSLTAKALKDLEYGCGIKKNFIGQEEESPFYINHQVLLAHIIEAFIKASTTQEKYRFVEVYCESDAFDTKTYIRPDAAFVIEFENQKVMFFVELERSWSTEKKIRSKLRRYERCIREGFYKSLTYHDVLDARVLFISSSKNSLQTLLQKIVSAKPAIDVLVGDFEEVYEQPYQKSFYGLNGNKYGIFNFLK